MKSMKKSMFVTTILMVVLLIVALSTATFAWYTANTTVGATKTTVTSASSSSASLVIDNQVAGSSGATNNSVTLTMTGLSVPMVYTSDTAVTVDTTTYSAFIGAFKTFTKDANNKFASVPGAAFVAPKTISAVSGSGSSANIVLTNVGGIAIDNIDITVTTEPLYLEKTGLVVGTSSVTNLYTEDEGVYTKITAENAKAEEGETYYEAHDYLNVAVFAGATEGALKLKGIYGASNTNAQRANATALTAAVVGNDIATVVGNATLSGDLASASAFKNSGQALPIASNVEEFGDTSGNGYSVVVKVVAWFEGVDMLNIDANLDASFTLGFTTRANA